MPFFLLMYDERVQLVVGGVVLAAAKRAIKAVVPQSLIAWGMDRAQSAMLSALPAGTFDVQNLGHALDLKQLFHEGVSTWEVDHNAIAAVYGEGERFGGVNPGDRRAIYYLVRMLRPKHVLEVGTHVGASTLHIARALRANGFGVLSTVDIIDVNAPEAWWPKVGLPHPPIELARQLDCADIVRFVVSGAQSFMKSPGNFDLIFLDGDHSPAAVYQEVALALRLLSPGGHILLHDYYPGGQALFENGDAIQGPYLAMTRVTRECPTISIQSLGALPWPTKQGSHMTSLALMARRA
jgi:predicted O-methyltransferase YrrM